MEKLFELSNGLKVVHKQMPQTPRVAINFFIKTGIIDEKHAGETSIITKLLLQGTKKLSAKQLADKIDFLAIDFITDVKHDYMKIKTVTLNNDLEEALDIMQDVIMNSTFENFEKEINKLKGEITSDLDSAKTKALDNLVTNLYKNHPYGNSHTKILKEIDKITKEDIKNLYFSKLHTKNCVISIVGDISENQAKELLEEYFALIPQKEISNVQISSPQLYNSKIVTIAKEDVAQAQIIQAWILPGIKNPDIPKLMILNSILGSCGLSSRLFLELREKKGLAYVVRSNFDVMEHASTFSLYIASEPKNINIALEGFKEEIEKLKSQYVTEQELQSAKNNILGKRAFLHETNSQKAHYLGYYELSQMGYEYDKNIEKYISEVSIQDIKDVANKYFSDKFVISLLAPKEFLP